MAAQTKAGEARQALDVIIKAGPQPTCVVWPFARTGKGYGAISIDGREYLVSRLVCRAINGEPPPAKRIAAHRCGNGHLGCVNPGCLYWATDSENQRDRLLHGTDGNGEKNPNAKLSTANVGDIRANKLGLKQRELAVIYGVTQAQISNILRGAQRAIS